MTWIDKLENSVFSITTGDGRVYTPLLRISETTKEFNASTFEFINKEGSFVDRRKVKARQFPLTFYFQGPENINQSEAFDKSANDSRAWVIVHPFYGNIQGQPISISRNDSSFNSTEFNVDFWETISDSLPKIVSNLPDIIKTRQVEFKVLSPIDYASKVTLKPSDISTVKSINEQLNATIANALDAVSYSDFQLIKNTAATKIDNMITSPVEAMQSIMDVIDMPENINTSTFLRISLVQAVYADVTAILKKFNSNNKAFYEAAAGASVVALANIVANPNDGDITTRNDLMVISDALATLYADYQMTIDSAYVVESESINKFSASVQTQNLIREIVVQTIAGISTQAVNAKQERVVVLEKDSNLILLCHQYMGLDKADENLNKFRKINNIKNKKLFSVKKGTAIKYYV